MSVWKKDSPFAAIGRVLASEGLEYLGNRLLKSPEAQLVTNIAKSLGTTPTVKAIEEKVATDPAAIERLAELQLRMMEVETAAVSEARETFKHSPWPGYVFMTTSAMMLVITGIFAFAFFKEDFDLSGGNVLLIQLANISSVFATAWVASVGYFIQSTIGSKSKDYRTDQAISSLISKSQ